MTTFKLIGNPPVDLFRKIGFVHDGIELRLVVDALLRSAKKQFPEWSYLDMVANCTLLKNDTEINFP